MIRCIITSIGSVLLGQVEEETKDKIVLNHPREVQIMQIAANQTKFAVLYVFGRPKLLTVSLKDVMLHYDVEDPSIISIYEEHISTIHRVRPGELELLTKETQH